MKLVILAAGKGTRFYPLTQKIPKALILIKDRPLLAHVLDPYLECVNEFIMVINDELGYLIQNYFGSIYSGKPVTYIIQKQSDQRGTLSALFLCRQQLVSEDMFIVANCDDLLLREDINRAIDKKVPGIGISYSTMPWNYLGIDVVDDRVTGFRRHEKTENLFVEDHFSNGFHILSPKIFTFEPVATRDGEFGLPQTLFDHLDSYPLCGFNFLRWQAVNGPENVSAAEDFIRMQKDVFNQGLGLL